MTKTWIVIGGNIRSGMQFVGPFESRASAEDFIATNEAIKDWREEPAGSYGWIAIELQPCNFRDSPMSESAEQDVEQVARAIAQSEGHDPDHLAPRTTICTADDQQLPWWQAFEEQARAAIEAMPAIPDGYVIVPREPTEAMKVAALNATFDDKQGDRVRVWDVPIIWQSMINAAPAIAAMPASNCDEWEIKWQRECMQKVAAQADVARLREALESIAGWRKVNISGEYEHSLRDIIRSITDCAAAALARAEGECPLCPGFSAPCGNSNCPQLRRAAP